MKSQEEINIPKKKSVLKDKEGQKLQLRQYKKMIPIYEYLEDCEEDIMTDNLSDFTEDGPFYEFEDEE